MTSAVRRAATDMTDGPILPLILRFAFPYFLGSVFQEFYHLVDTMVVGIGLGDRAIAAHISARRIYTLLQHPAGALPVATSTFVGQNWGAGRKDRIRRGLRVVLTLALGFSAFACLTVFLLGPDLIRLVTGTGDAFIIENGAFALRVLFVFYPALGLLLCLRSALQAIGFRSVPAISSGIELTVKAVCAWFFIPRFGYAGACFAEPVSWLLCAVFVAVVWLKKHKQILS